MFLVRQNKGNSRFFGKGINFINRTTFCKISNGLFLFGISGNIIYVKSKFSDWVEDFSYFTLFGDSIKVNRINEIKEDCFRKYLDSYRGGVMYGKGSNHN